MNNIVLSLRKFLKNKNTVTVLGVIIIVAILYFGYNSTVRSQTEPIQVCVSTTTIQPRQEITSQNTMTIAMPKVGVVEGAARDCRSVVGQFVNYNAMIPKGSMFFTDTYVTFDKLPDANFVKVKDGEIPYKLPVSLATTYGNAIFPENKIDIYMKAINSSGQLMVGKLLFNVEVLFVKDSAGRHVFENTAENRTPAYLIFGLVPEQFYLLTKAGYMTNFGVELFPVPHGGTANVEGATEITSQQLKDFINANTVPNDDLINIPSQSDNSDTTLGG